MNNKPIVSVIIIFLNEEIFIREAIESVIEQSYKSWELLLIDDGSSDQSTNIAKQYTEIYPGKVYYYSHPAHKNLGMSASRNSGIQKSFGEYIAFLDADDIWLPGKLEEQTKILNEFKKAMMVYGRTLVWNSWNSSSDSDFFYDLGVKAESLIDPPELFYLLLENKAQTPTTCNCMIRRNIFEEIGFFEDDFRGMYEDQVFFSKLLLKFPVYVSNKTWAKYRQHKNSCTNKSIQNENYYLTRQPFLYWLENYLNLEGFSKNSKIYRAFNKELWLNSHPKIHSFINKIKKAGLTTK